MNEKTSYFDPSSPIKGIYGDFIVNSQDKREVLYYRLSILLCGLFFSIGLFEWFLNGSNHLWIYLIGIAFSLGLCLKWIHIYIKPLHQVLIIFWAIGCVGIGIVSNEFGFTNIIFGLKDNPKWIFLIGPLFASLAGIGFKEFFCFRRAEAIGITIFLPISFFGYLTRMIDERLTFILLVLSSLLLLLMGIRKFNLPAEADIGDKSVFEHLENQRMLRKPDIS